MVRLQKNVPNDLRRTLFKSRNQVDITPIVSRPGLPCLVADRPRHLLEVFFVRLAQAYRERDIGGRHPLPKGHGVIPVQSLSDEFFDRTHHLEVAVMVIELLHLIDGQVPALALAIQAVELGPYLLHVEAVLKVDLFTLDGPESPVPRWVIQIVAIIYGREEHSAARELRLCAIVRSAEGILIFREK